MRGASSSQTGKQVKQLRLFFTVEFVPQLFRERERRAAGNAIGIVPLHLPTHDRLKIAREHHFVFPPRVAAERGFRPVDAAFERARL